MDIYTRSRVGVAAQQRRRRDRALPEAGAARRARRDLLHRLPATQHPAHRPPGRPRAGMEHHHILPDRRPQGHPRPPAPAAAVVPNCHGIPNRPAPTAAARGGQAERVLRGPAVATALAPRRQGWALFYCRRRRRPRPRPRPSRSSSRRHRPRRTRQRRCLQRWTQHRGQTWRQRRPRGP